MIKIIIFMILFKLMFNFISHNPKKCKDKQCKEKEHYCTKIFVNRSKNDDSGEICNKSANSFVEDEKKWLCSDCYRFKKIKE